MFLSFFLGIFCERQTVHGLSVLSPRPSPLPLSAGLTQPPPSQAGIPSLLRPHASCSRCREADFFSPCMPPGPCGRAGPDHRPSVCPHCFSEQPAPATKRKGAVVLCLQCVPRPTLQGCRPVAACCLWRHGTDTGREVALKKLAIKKC